MKPTKSNPLWWKLGFRLIRVKVSFGVCICVYFRSWESGQNAITYWYLDVFIYRWGFVAISPLGSVLVTRVVNPTPSPGALSHHLHHHSVTQILLDKITTLSHTPSPPPASLVPPTSTNHDPPMGVIQWLSCISLLLGGPPFPLGVRSLTFWQRMKVSRQKAGVGLANVGVKRPASSSGSG